MVRARVGDARTSRIGGVSPLPAAPFAAWLGAVPRRAHRRSHRSCVDPTYELDLRPCRLQTSRAQAMPRLCELVLRRARMAAQNSGRSWKLGCEEVTCTGEPSHDACTFETYASESASSPNTQREASG